MTKRIFISTGGSGGHVVPATILYEHLKDKFYVSISTDYRGMKFLDKDKYNLEIFNITPISKNIFLLPLHFFLIIYLEKNEKIKLILTGTICLIIFQALIHIGVNIRLFPTTGMTLPFLSYGGSSIVGVSILSGIILNLTKRKID